MKCFRFISTILLAIMLAFAACDDGSGGGKDSGDNGGGDTVVSIAAVPGVVVPVRGAVPVTAITETDQYTGTVSWSPDNNPFAEKTVYTATIVLTAKHGFTMNGVAANFFTVAGATTVSNAAGSGVVFAVFPATGLLSDTNVVFQSAAQTGGISEIADSTGLTLTFSVDPTTLTADNITVTGAAKGALTGTGTTRTLAISGITVANGETVSVTITSPSGYAITGSEQTAVVYRKTAGNKVTLTADSMSFTMAYVPGGLTFPTGVNDDGTATVTNAYWIGETEVTYELWKKVYDWATNPARGANVYSFANLGARGGYYDSGEHTYLIEHETHPVTMVNWRDCMIWCNALTEWYNAQNGTSNKCVYYADANYATPIRAVSNAETVTNTTPGSQDCPYIYSATTGNTDIANCTATGFRLLTDNEWELAARYRGSDSTNSVSGYSNPYYTQGDSASGATADRHDGTATGLVTWYKDNSGSSTHEVKTRAANSLGLYDMSGNVREWCFDWRPSYRIHRGGSFIVEILGLVYLDLYVGGPSGLSPYNRDYNMGLRFARLAD